MASVSIRYEVVCRNYDQLTEGVANSLLEVVTKSLAGELITEETKNECLNETSPADHRAKKLVDALTRGIQLNDSIFDQFVSILHEIPALSYLAGRLEGELNNRSGRDAGDRISNGGDHRKDEPKTEVGMDTDGASVWVDSTSKASESMPKPNEKQKSLVTPEFTGDEQHQINEPASQLLQVSNRALVAQDEEIPIEASDRGQQSISDTRESGAKEKDDLRSEFTERQQSEKERDLRVRELEREKLKDKKNYKSPVEIKYLKAHLLKKGAEVQMEKERKNGIEKVVRAAEELKVNAELQNPEAEAQSEQKDMPLQNTQELRETKSRDKNDIEKERQRNAEMEVENHQTATNTYDQEAQRRRADSGSPHQQSADLSPVAISPKRKVSSERDDESSESDLEESDSEGDVVKSKPLTLDKQPIQEACPGGFSNEFVLSSTPAKGRRDECLPYDAQQALQAKDAQIDGLKTQVEERISSEEPLRQQLEHKTQEVEVLKERLKKLKRELKKQKEKHQVKVTALNAELQQKNEELEDCKKRVVEMERNHQETLVKEREAATQRLNNVEKECEAKIREQTEKCQGLQDKIKRLNNEKKFIQLEYENRTLKLERDLEKAKRELAEKACELAEKEKENYTQMCEIDRLQTRLDISGELHDLKKKNEKLEKDHSKFRRESQAKIDELKRHLSDSPPYQAQQKPSLDRSQSLPL